MDDSLLAQFQSSLGEIHDSFRPLHPHYTLYKAKGEGYGNQEARRRRFLEEQQNRRRDYADHARQIAEGGDIMEEDSDDGAMEEGGFDEVDAAQASPTSKVSCSLLCAEPHPPVFIDCKVNLFTFSSTEIW